MVRIEGASYSVPSHWASLRATAYVGVEDIRIHCCSQTETYSRECKGTRKVRYRHYLSELSKKPQAVRQVAPEIVTELGEPYGKLWSMLTDRYGAREASSILARILGVLVDHGEGPVSEALATALSQGRTDLLCLASYLGDRGQRVRTTTVPEALSGYRIEATDASVYDRLLTDGQGGAA
jgi:hypothetical protein